MCVRCGHRLVKDAAHRIRLGERSQPAELVLMIGLILLLVAVYVLTSGPGDLWVESPFRPHY